MYKSPNGTIRNYLNGTIFREPILIKNVEKYIKSWKKPIIIARHAFGDQYKAKDVKIQPNSQVYLKVVTNNEVTEIPVRNYKNGGVAMAMFNTKDSITQFAHQCF